MPGINSNSLRPTVSVMEIFLPKSRRQSLALRACTFICLGIGSSYLALRWPWMMPWLYLCSSGCIFLTRRFRPFEACPALGKVNCATLSAQSISLTGISLTASPVQQALTAKVKATGENYATKIRFLGKNSCKEL